MVTSCVAYGCTNRLKKGCGLTFHLFPKNAEVRSLWERAVRREGWRAKDGDRLCSVHFTPECFDRTGQTTRLRVGSVPMSFPAFPPHLQKPVKQKRPDPKSRDFPAPPGPECSGLCDLPGAENFPEDSPTKQFYKDKVLSSQEEITQLKKKVKTLQQTKRRLAKRKETAQEIIKEMREQKLLSEEGSHLFSSVFSDDIQQLLCRVGNEQKGKYPPELRAFALTLHFYSPAAYEYVRSKLNEALPSQRTLRGWYKSIQAAPGFTAEAFAFLEKFAEARDETFYCALIVDDMAIRKHVELVGDKVVGYVDFGTGR
ncbi:THAP domain-containing protein 1-like [Rhipicephalus microplus]|uniref:THAP domain-containing protein 1-like n=1 Tax=Rhipicephalus microplus TaxID=6941 RepID=UPI003F6CF752